MKKRVSRSVLSLILTLCLTLSMLPSPALAAVGDLVDNDPAENESILSQLEDFSGQSYEEAYTLLDSLGLLDEDGNLATDQSIVLDGEEYTLEEIEAQLNDPTTDLTKVAEVDEMPIALGDLKTIIAIERELQYLQEKYFTGATFQGEARNNLNSLMTQLQTEGITLSASNSAENQIVFDTSEVKTTTSVDGLPVYYIEASEVNLPPDAQLSVRFKLNHLSDALYPNISIQFIGTSPSVYLSTTPQTAVLDQNSGLEINSDNSEILYPTNSPEQSYSVSVNTTSYDGYNGPLYLCMRGPSHQSPEALDYPENFDEFSFGDLWQSVSFYDADGFLFQNGENGPLRDQWTGYFSVSHTLPTMTTSAKPDGKTTTMPTNKFSTHEYIWLQLASMGLTELENTLTYLQRCIDEMGSDKAIRTHVSATIEQTNRANVDYSTSVPEVNRTLIVPEDVFRGPNAYIVGIDYDVSEFPLNIPSGTSKTIAYDIISTTPSPTYTLNFGLYLYFCKNQDVIWDQVRSDREWEYIDSVNGYTVTSSNLSYSLVNDATKPSLTVSALEGNYRSGDVIPITITGNEFIKVDNLDNAKIKINDAEYSLRDLHASSSGKYITLFYEVKEIDAGTLTVGIPEGTITDYWENGNTEVNNETVDGVNITTPVLKNAVTGLSASYNVSTGEVEFSIAVSQVEQYRNLYNLYTNTNPAFQLLVTVEDGEAQTVAVTMGEDSNRNTIFTAEPLAVKRAAEDQPITVQIQANDGSGKWETVRRFTANTTVPARVPVTDVEIDVAEKPEGYNYQIALSDTDIPKLEATFTPDNTTYKTGSWSSNNEEIATIDATGQIELTSGKVGEVAFTFTADNGTPSDISDDIESKPLEFTVTAGDELTLVFPTYAQDSLVREGKDATVKWNTNAFVYYPGKDITFTVNLYKGQDTNSDPVYTGTVENETELTIPAENLTADYPQSQYTVQVSMTEPESCTATASITVLSPPTVMRVNAKDTSITEQDTLTLDCTISNDSATGTLSATRVTENEATSNADDCLDKHSVSGGKGTVIFTPKSVEEGSLYDTYTITFTEEEEPSDNFTPSTDSIVITVYRSGALEIEGDDTINLSNVSKVEGMIAESASEENEMASEDILALRQELGLLEFIRVNADDYNWSSISDGIRWVSSNPDAVSVNYRQGGLWDNIEDLPYETYLPESQMSVSATADVEDVTVTATHVATGMSDSVTVNVDTLRHQFYLFQATPAEKTQVAYTNGDGERVTTYTNKDGLLALYEPSGIDSNVVFNSGEEKNPNLGTILKENLASGEKDAAKLQLYPLNTITLQPAAKAEVYLVEPDGSSYVGNVTLRGGVYLAGIYSDNALLGNAPGSLQNGGEDATYTTDPNGKLTVYMDATQFRPDGYGGQLTNADLDYWFELSDIDNNTYYPTLVNIQGTMSPDYKLRTGSAVVTLTKVPDGEAEQPFLIAQTLSYAKENADEGLQVRSVLGSTGKVGPNSTYKYTELTSRIMLWGVDNDLGESNVLMTGEDGFAPEAQTVDVNTFPFASIPIITNTLVLTEDTMTNSGWLEAETPESLSASIYQNDVLMKTVTMPFQVVDLTNVKLVDDDAQALVVEMTGSFTDSVGNNQFSLGTDNKVSDAFGEDIRGMLNTLNTLQETGNPLFRVLITPSEDSSVFNVLIWGGYNSLDIDDFDYSTNGFTTGSSLMEAELNVGVPPLNDLSDMAKGTYDPIGSINEAKYNRTNSGLDIGAQLEGYYEGQFYYDLDQGKWAFRTVSGGMTAGASLSFQANINAWVGPVPITATFAAGIAMQLDFKAATVYKDQVSDTSGWKEEHLKADSVNDYLTTLRIQGYIDAFGGLGFDYCVLALKIGLYGRLTGDTTNTFLSRTYLEDEDNSQMSGHAVGVNGEVGIKFFAKFLFVSYETVIASGHFNATSPDENYQYINDYWNGSGASGASLTSMGAPTLLSRAYLAAYAGSASQRWSNPASFGSQATEVQSDANPGSEPAVNDDGSLSVYISDMGVEDYFASRIMAGSVGTEGEVIDNNGYGDMSPSISGDSSFTVAAWIRLFENLDKNAGEKITSAEEKQLLNSTEIMVATTADNGGTWTVNQLTKNASPDLAPATAANNGNAIVFWRSAYTSSDDPFAEGENNKLNFDTQDNIWFRQYNKDGKWDDAKMVYNGSLGSVVGMQAAMLPDGNAILAFTIDRTDNIKATGYEMAYRTVASDGTLGDLVVLTNDSEIDTNPQVTAVNKDGTNYFVLGWYSSRSDGNIRLQAVNGAGQLYTGHNQYAVPESTSAIIGESNLAVSSDFRFAKGVSQDVDGLTLVWAETADVVAEDGTATPDHSVLYGVQLCAIDETMYLSSPQALITLPNRTLSNSFSAWKDSGTVNAYIFGTWYDPVNTDPNYEDLSVPLDTDKLLTGGGSMVPNAVTVDQIVVDYQNLQTLSFTPVVFTLRNTGTTKLTNLTVDVGGYKGSAVTLYPGESATVTVMYKTGDPISNPTYTIGVDAENQLVSDTLYLNYNDIGISSMDVVSEGEGKRTVQMTLYNDAAAKLKGSGRTVELGFYTDSAYTKPAEIQLVGQQNGVSLSNNKITLSGDDVLERLDLGVLTLQVTYNLANYVNNTLKQEEVPGSGVQLYAMAQIRDDKGVMREFATGNNMTSVQLTGALARTGETTTLDVTLDNTSGKTKATVTLKNNSLRSQPSGGTLVAVLLDENGKSLDSKVVTTNSALTCEQTLEVDIEFEKLGVDVVVLYDNSTDSSGLQELRFSGIPVGLGDFEQALDEDGQHIADQYVLTLDDDAPASTVVSFISGDPVTVNGTEYDKAGSAEVDIPYGNSTITIVSGGVTYIMNLNRSYPYSGGGSTGYKVKVEPTENGTVTVSPTSPKKGDTVTITATPDEDYKVGTVTVTDEDGKAVAVSGGDGKYTFTQPGSNVTVAVKFIWDSPFSDVGDAWYTEAVHYVYENGLMAGTGATTFDPEMKLTRAMTAQILYNLEGKPQVTEDATFTDMDVAPTWSLDAIAWAQDTGVVAGMGNNLFDPNANVTREQFAQMMYNYASYKKLDLTATGDLTQFPDGDQVSNWAETALSWANGKGLINGHAESGLLDPQGNTTRAQAASIIANFDKNVAK